MVRGSHDTTDLDSAVQARWSDAEDYVFKPRRLSVEIVREMSAMKHEPEWMLKFRLKAWIASSPSRWPRGSRSTCRPRFDNIYYYIKPTEGQVNSWTTFPTPSRTPTRSSGSRGGAQVLSGVTAQYESEVVFHRNRADLEAQGVLFCDMDTAIREYPDMVRRWFGTIIPPTTTSSRR